MPIPNLKYLNLRVVRRKDQKVAQRTQKQEYWAAYKKDDAAFRRNTCCLRRLQWRQMREGHDARLPQHRAWRIALSLLPPVARQAYASFAIAFGMSLPLAIEHQANEFASSVQSPRLLRQDCTAGASLGPLLWADDDFTTDELKHAMRCRDAPSQNEVTSQALKI